MNKKSAFNDASIEPHGTGKTFSLRCYTCNKYFDPLGVNIYNCRYCGAWTCIRCGEKDGEDFTCKHCIEATCVKCGGEGGNVLACDESVWKCGDCGYIDMEK